MYALVEIKGFQYKAEKGKLLRVSRLENEKGKKVEFESVLFISDDDKVKCGNPYVKNAKVKGVVQDHIRGDKVIVFKHKKRKRYNKKYGHRQPYTLVMVEDITQK
ncbi:MAG: 50S ribosomal protein L21 [Spirochaetales bacterium]|nr:50S ribosomal protein L21 [Spirochaetales bacterium]